MLITLKLQLLTGVSCVCKISFINYMYHLIFHNFPTLILKIVVVQNLVCETIHIVVNLLQA